MAGRPKKLRSGEQPGRASVSINLPSMQQSPTVVDAEVGPTPSGQPLMPYAKEPGFWQQVVSRGEAGRNAWDFNSAMRQAATQQMMEREMAGLRHQLALEEAVKRRDIDIEGERMKTPIMVDRETQLNVPRVSLARQTGDIDIDVAQQKWLANQGYITPPAIEFFKDTLQPIRMNLDKANMEFDLAQRGVLNKQTTTPEFAESVSRNFYDMMGKQGIENSFTKAQTDVAKRTAELPIYGQPGQYLFGQGAGPGPGQIVTIPQLPEMSLTGEAGPMQPPARFNIEGQPIRIEPIGNPTNEPPVAPFGQPQQGGFNPLRPISLEEIERQYRLRNRLPTQ